MSNKKKECLFVKLPLTVAEQIKAFYKLNSEILALKS